MKKLFVGALALLVLGACGSGERKFLDYRGLSMGMTSQAFFDSLAQRGFTVDSAHTDTTSNTLVLANPSANYRVLVAQHNGAVLAVQENYKLSTNDSTRRYYRELYDHFEKEIGAWPNPSMLKDDHKVVKFEADGGFITLTLENTYKPTLSVLYENKKE